MGLDSNFTCYSISGSRRNLSKALEPEQLFEKLSPSIWVVNVYDKEDVRTGHGSAVVIGKGELITNCHVLAKSKSVRVKREHAVHQASLIHADAARDLCILKAEGVSSSPIEISPVKTVRIGQRVYAIGAPRGYELTFSDGLVSSLIRNDSDEEIDRIQISVPISPGSSGGGLFDQSGRLIGVTSSGRIDAQNLNFAIPAEWIKEVPKRSQIALAEFNEKRRPIENATGNQGEVPVKERQLVGDEFIKQLSSFGTAACSTGVSSPDVRLMINQQRTSYSMEFPARPWYNLIGYHVIKNNNTEICFRSANRFLHNYKDCFRLFALGEGKLIFRSVTDNAALTCQNRTS